MDNAIILEHFLFKLKEIGTLGSLPLSGVQLSDPDYK